MDNKVYIEKVTDINLSNKIFNILAECSNYMYTNYGLEHWKPVYDIEFIKNDIKNRKFYGIYIQDTLIGCFLIDINEQSEVSFGKFAIRPKYQGKKYGKFAINFIEKNSIKLNKTKIIIEVYIKSYNAIEFYKKCGFICIGSKFTRRFEVLIMEKNLGGKQK